MGERNDNGAEKRVREKHRRVLRRKTWRILRPILIGLISLALCVGCLSVAGNYLLDKFVRPVDKSDATPITVTISKGSGASAIAKLLYEACGEGEQGLISSKAAFKVYVDFTGKSSILKAGTYVLSKNMAIPQMVDIICMGNPPKETVKFTIPEGLSVEGIADKLVELGILKDTSDFLILCKGGEQFSQYSFIASILNGGDAGDRDYVLEGYLFPDTYEVYTDASAETIITKMLIRFNEMFDDDCIARAQELNMSVDDVITLASMIEKEAKTDDFAKVSAVFHNRLDQDMKLESDAPLQYIWKTESVLDFTQEQMSVNSPYNTYVVAGLPVGAIDNPGKNAVDAALYPDEEFVGDGYLYFVLKAKDSTELVFAKTYEEHLANKEAYQGS